MNRVQNAIFPGTVIGCVLVILTINAITNPKILLNTIGLKQPRHTLSSCYPQEIRQWQQWIETYAQENNLESDLVAAVIYQESGGNAMAYSHSGAVGLMQVMPRDGLASGFMCNGTPCFSNRPTMQELFDPEYNIAFGSRFLSSLVQHYGSVREALRAYGPADMGYRYADLVLSIYASCHQ